MKVIYENSFDINEWYVLTTLTVLIVLVWITPKILPLTEAIVYLLYGIFVGMFYDHTVSVKPWDFYDVNDSSAYQVIDFISYLVYGPHSYFFIYFYVKFRIKGFKNILYVFIWVLFSLVNEWIALKVGLFHYEKGFSMYWSVSTYVLAQTSLILLYHIIRLNRTFVEKQF
ncbi:hypothetical protein [Alkalihalobacillus sp. AL-G]|uniref:hypothetical protein n=1 Tax=Alkalihalobacillus sp. AL-G TaxID=2926399 RepID=UPI00272D8FE3|nr:hypothetical protein [Alkalihalobacillus sp. AL-G]WLD91625.1 hypothetical protein MOJ78_11260 [Alkalihalobacillus sp. AL-G]